MRRLRLRLRLQGTNHRKVTLTGTPEAIQIAQFMIAKKARPLSVPCRPMPSPARPLSALGSSPARLLSDPSMPPSPSVVSAVSPPPLA